MCDTYKTDGLHDPQIRRLKELEAIIAILKKEFGHEASRIIIGTVKIEL